MNTTTIAGSFLITLLALTGCTQSVPKTTANRPASTTASASPDSTRRMVTGSHVPQPVDRPTFDNVSATAPSQGSGRLQPSLVPTEPTVGAGSQSTYRLGEPSTGAGPEGSAPQPTPN